MELTSKQRAQLRGIANSIDTIVIIGKDGITENLVKQANDALEAREIMSPSRSSAPNSCSIAPASARKRTSASSWCGGDRTPSQKIYKYDSEKPDAYASYVVMR